MYQQWLQVAGLTVDGLGFSLIAFEWYRGYLEMRNRVTLVARDLERAQKIQLHNEIKQAVGMAGVGEVEALYKDDKALAEMAEHAFEMDQVERFKKTRAPLFLAGVIAFVIGIVLQLLGTWPGCCPPIGIVPQSFG